jgi:hypothetical protein
MYILIGNNNLVLDASTTIAYQENGNPITAENMAYAKYLVSTVKDVATIPADFDRNKYFYTEANGFTINPDWMDPNDALNIKQVKEDLSTLQQHTADTDYILMMNNLIQ